MDSKELLARALRFEFLNADEATFIFQNAPAADLAFVANELRKAKAIAGEVSWIIDRNVNTTNICVANCKFCNFYRLPGADGAYITSMDEYRQKIRELFNYGGDQLLLQGGHHPELGLSYYTDLFRKLKAEYPTLKLHALGPPEIAHICRVDGITHTEALSALLDAGLDSLPGAGAEILSNRVRKLISNGKCSAGEWLDVMRTAHQLHITTTATMMFGHVETIEERMEHLVLIREVQEQKPKDAKGFIAFIPWPFQADNTLLQKNKGLKTNVTADEYIRMIALSRIMLPNIDNIQASWLTVGSRIAQACLHAGANDMGSIMMEENVVSAAGANHTLDAAGIRAAIREAGFTPRRRNQQYEKYD
ncbi:MAG: cyclic dehypoxanthinyl futalosine synthase [Flavobacteriales bacterium]